MVSDLTCDAESPGLLVRTRVLNTCDELVENLVNIAATRLKFADTFLWRLLDNASQFEQKILNTTLATLQAWSFHVAVWLLLCQRCMRGLKTL